MSNVVPRFTMDRTELRKSGGDIGEDNRNVYQRWLGLSDRELERLAQQKIV